MKLIITSAVFLSLATPALAEESDMSEGMELLSKGAELFLKGLMAEMEPAIDDLQDAIGNLNAYHPPEVLPNGDIVIRRKVPLVPEVDPEAEVDL